MSPQTPSGSTGWVWLAPVYGLTSRVEVALPIEFVTSKAGSEIADFGAEARIRIFDRSDSREEYDLAESIRLRSAAHSFEGKVFNVVASYLSAAQLLCVTRRDSFPSAQHCLWQFRGKAPRLRIDRFPSDYGLA